MGEGRLFGIGRLRKSGRLLGTGMDVWERVLGMGRLFGKGAYWRGALIRNRALMKVGAFVRDRDGCVGARIRDGALIHFLLLFPTNT